jgi:glutathione synthase/RimK-type ligase-like ATP-grasp enzyme
MPIHRLNAHARYAAYAAERLGLRFRLLDDTDGYLFEVSDGVRHRVFAAGSATPYVENVAAAYTIARDKYFAAQAMNHAGVHCLTGMLFFLDERTRRLRSPGREAEDALRHAATFKYPVFCKPNAGSRGELAEQIDSPEQFADYLRRAAAVHDAILVQPVHAGDEYRVFVYGGQALFAYRKHCVSAGAGMRARALNRAAGGGAADFTTDVPPQLAHTAIAACRAIGLCVGGVDLFTGGEEGAGEGPCVIEVNANPMIETLEDQGRWDLIELIWTRNFQAALR